jgi:uncharacterized protein YlxP (DUF503 family)
MKYRIGTLCLRIRVEHSRSLKDKRRVLRSLKDRLKRRHNVAIAEVAHQDRRREAVVVAAAVASSANGVRRILDSVHKDAVGMLGRSLWSVEFDDSTF